jgi:dipeptidyl-peptidase-4
MCLFQEPHMFKVAVSGAPVTNWDGYDTHYTERYMSTPAKNKDGYRNGNVTTFVDNMTARNSLLIIHGLIDENVHFRHTARLITEMTKKRKKYDLLLLPSERHSPRTFEDRVYLEQEILNRFKAYL